MPPVVTVLPSKSPTTPRIPKTYTETTIEEMLVRNQNLTEDYLIPLELRDDDTFTEADRQRALQT